jgi:hypothetical protein
MSEPGKHAQIGCHRKVLLEIRGHMFPVRVIAWCVFSCAFVGTEFLLKNAELCLTSIGFFGGARGGIDSTAV